MAGGFLGPILRRGLPIESSRCVYPKLSARQQAVPYVLVPLPGGPRRQACRLLDALAIASDFGLDWFDHHFCSCSLAKLSSRAPKDPSATLPCLRRHFWGLDKAFEWSWETPLSLGSASGCRWGALPADLTGALVPAPRFDCRRQPALLGRRLDGPSVRRQKSI